jgi:hypothetical protein
MQDDRKLCGSDLEFAASLVSFWIAASSLPAALSPARQSESKSLQLKGYETPIEARVIRSKAT